MTKIFGAAVLVAAGLLIGRANAARCWDKAAAIHSLIEILELVRAGLQSRKRLSEICISASGAEGYCGAFFRVLAKGLQASAETGARWLHADLLAQLWLWDKVLMMRHSAVCAAWKIC